TGNAAAINPVLHGASLRPSREVEHAIAGILPPPSQFHELTGCSDASAHGFDFALIFGAEGIISLDLGDERHAPLLRRDAVLAPAPAHAEPLHTQSDRISQSPSLLLALSLIVGHAPNAPVLPCNRAASTSCKYQIQHRLLAFSSTARVRA